MTEKNNRNTSNAQRGQALVEYTLVAVLVIMAFAFVVAATAPVVGNIFSNTVVNLLNAETPIPAEDIPKSDDFWATVTWVYQNTPAEVPLPTRTQPPPTFTPTAGPSPTNTPITPTNTPAPTNTPRPTSTPRDKQLLAPWYDSANPSDIENWRLDSRLYLGSEGWYGEYYGNMTLSGQPDFELKNEEIDKALKYAINFRWGNGAPFPGWPTGHVNNGFSTIWRRPIYLEAQTTLRFDIPVMDDGIRIWIVGGVYGGVANPQNGGPGTCSGITHNGNQITTGYTGTTNNRYDDARFGYNPSSGGPPPTECLIYDAWRDQNSSASNIQRTVPAGLYMLQVEYYENGGGADVEVQISSNQAALSPADTAVDTAGNPVAGGSPSCQWGQVGLGSGWADDVNSKEYMWDEYQEGDISPLNRCHLELRGYVEIPPSMTDPLLTFWDVWDFNSTAMDAWVEIGEYLQAPGGGLDRDNMVWTRIPIHSGNTYNYNWTYQRIRLQDYIPGIVGKKVALRFVIQARAASSTRRWFIDDIAIDYNEEKAYTFDGQLWQLDNDAEARDFITSGRWELNSNNPWGGLGMSWDDSPNANYDDFDGVRTNNSQDRNLRMHTIEINGFIDPNDPNGLQDSDGDTGEPLLSFWHGYYVGSNTGLEIQYTTNPYSAGDSANWQVVPGGTLRSRTDSSTVDAKSLTLVEVGLGDLISALGPTTKFRLRFAMTVQDTHDPREGWWIDNIRLERRGAPKFTDYPYFDSAEYATDEWLMGSPWGRAQGGIFAPGEYTDINGDTQVDNGMAYTDSPNGDYSRNTNSSLELRYPIDMKLDTPENPKSPTCNLGAGLCQPVQSLVPVNGNPLFTFWHWRNLSSGEDFYVEWKRFDETNWRPLWAYINRMTTRNTWTSSRTTVQLGWEYVEVDLAPVVQNILANDVAGNPTDDDIVIRIRFTSDSGSTADGIYIDHILLDERVERVHALWNIGQQAQDNNGNPVEDAEGNAVLGKGSLFYDGVDNDGGFLSRWSMGGDWQTVAFTQRKGLYSFHDSADGQDGTPETSGSTVANMRDNTFNVLEMKTIIDLRGVDASSQPIFYFWSRYYVRSNDILSVQISYEDSSLSGLCSNGMDQCYEHNYGWSEWETVWERTYDRTYTWERQQISLAQYAKQPNGNEGRRIRIRFVSDALDTANDNQDGWYIDEVRIEYYQPRVYTLPFFDGARNLSNWVAEGNWGLSPEFFRGSGGGPASLGTSTWEYGYWDVGSCSSWNFNTCVGNILDADDDFSTANRPANAPGLTLDINNDYQWGGPYAGWTSNRFAGRWRLTTPLVDGIAVSPGKYTFITVSDDGVRMKYESATGQPLPAPDPEDPPTGSSEWNIIYNWTDHGRTIDMGTAKLAAGDRYTFTLEYYEKTSQAVIILTTGSNSFSFTDSPKQGSGPAFEEIPSVPRGNSSLILDGVFDLTGTSGPILQYYTYHELGGTALVEVTTDGGFTWTQNGLRGSVPASIFTSPWQGTYYDGKSLNYSGQAASFSRSDGNQLWFEWGNGSPQPGWQTDTFSVRWTRNITIPAGGMQVTFFVNASDGFRLWLDYTNGCATYNGNPIISGQGKTNDDLENHDPSTSCLLIDDWENNSANSKQVTRTIPAGNHTLQMDYYENTGSAYILLEMSTGDLGVFNDPTYGGTVMPDQSPDWVLKQHDLRGFAGEPALGLRFRLDRRSTDSTNNRTQSPINWATSWWIADITVLDP